MTKKTIRNKIKLEFKISDLKFKHLNDIIKIEKIVSNGQKSPDNFWYEQEKSEFILLLEGYAILEFEDREIELIKGDCLNIKAMQKHRVKYTSEKEPTIWFAVFY